MFFYINYARNVYSATFCFWVKERRAVSFRVSPLLLFVPDAVCYSNKRIVALMMQSLVYGGPFKIAAVIFCSKKPDICT
jgi:hypothetical protein